MPCVVPESGQTAPNDGTFATLRYICTVGMQPFFWMMSRKRVRERVELLAWITPVSFLSTEVSRLGQRLGRRRVLEVVDVEL